MKNICIIGTGQIGSRHLQALKNVTIPLSIHLVDPSADSLKRAIDRYKEFKGKNNNHQISCYSSISELTKDLDLVIVATNSDIRSSIVSLLLKKIKVKYFILEKLLFQKKKDYTTIGSLFKKNKVRAWVNCSMRTMHVYSGLKEQLDGNIIHYAVTGSQFGLITNSIHYIDHMAYLSDSYHCCVEAASLDKKVIQSKRKGFLELNGTLNVRFDNGTTGSLTCLGEGSLPIQVEIYNKGIRFISRENEQKAWISTVQNNWKWEEQEAVIPFQSQMTTSVVEDLLKNGSCKLTPFEESASLHLSLLEPLNKIINKYSGKNYNYYPFT